MARRKDFTEAELAADEAAQERGSALANVGRRASGWIHTKHPDTGADVVFKAGELLPEWAPDRDEDEAL